MKRETEHEKKDAHIRIGMEELSGYPEEFQQEMLRSIYDTVPCGILRMRREKDDFRLIAINPAAVRLLGFRSVEEIDTEWKDGIADSVFLEDRHILMDANQELYTHKKRRVWVEYRVLWPDGSTHWLRGSHFLVSESGGVQIIQRMVIDVTESHELEEQLRREREMYRLALESSSDVMYEYTMDTDVLITYEPRIDEKGKSSVEKSEFPDYQALLQNVDIAPPEDRQKILDNICKGKCETFECRFRTPDVPARDQYWWYRVTGRLISRNGLPYRVVGTIHNIQKKKEENQELQMSQSALQAINSSYLAIYFVNLTGDWSYGVNLSRMGGSAEYERQYNFMKDFTDYIGEYVEEPYRQRLYDIVSTENLRMFLNDDHGRIGVEYLEKREGREHWLRIELYLIAGQEKGDLQIVLSFRNVTEEKQQELARKREEEEAMNAMQDAYEAARSANMAKNDFLSRMSHDIRTPMNAVLGMTAIAEKNLSDMEKVKDCLSKIRVSGNHLLNLINEVLDMSKIEGGSAQLIQTPFSIRDVLRETQQIMQPGAVRKEQEFIVEVEKLEHDDVEGDAVRLQQILLNLLSNAIKYTAERGHIRMTVSEMLSSEQGTGCYRFVVEDDGIGMDEKYLEKIFTPFERVEDSRVSSIQGTGLGLAIAKNLIQMMNGTIEVESQLGKGTRFTVTVYLKLGNDFRPKRSEDGMEADIPFSEGQWRVLLTDDNSMNREIARELLEMHNVQVEEAEDGKQALEMFLGTAEGYYDLILMDIQMPVMNGYEATRQIRKLSRPDAAVIPIIALSANVFADDILESKLAGMDMHLAKPFDVQQVWSALKDWQKKHEFG